MNRCLKEGLFPSTPCAQRFANFFTFPTLHQTTPTMSVVAILTCGFLVGRESPLPMSVEERTQVEIQGSKSFESDELLLVTKDSSCLPCAAALLNIVSIIYFPPQQVAVTFPSSVSEGVSLRIWDLADEFSLTELNLLNRMVSRGYKVREGCKIRYLSINDNLLWWIR